MITLLPENARTLADHSELVMQLEAVRVPSPPPTPRTNTTEEPRRCCASQHRGRPALGRFRAVHCDRRRQWCPAARTARGRCGRGGGGRECKLVTG